MTQPSVISDLQDLLDEGPVARQVGDVIHRPDAENPAPMMVNERTGPKKYDIYNTLTGLKTTVDRNRIVLVMNKRREDGKPAFSLQPIAPDQLPGALLCPLHQDAFTRPLADELHLGACLKSNLVNIHEVRAHFESTHRRSARAFKEHEEQAQRQEDRAERQEDRALQRQMLERLGSVAVAQAPAVVAEPEPAEEPPVANRNRVYLRECDVCEEHFTGRLARVAQGKLDKHKGKVHGG